MRPGNLTTGIAQLNAALKDWRVRREETRLGWNDAIRHEFEEKHCLPLETETLAAVRNMEELAGVLAQLRQEVT